MKAGEVFRSRETATPSLTVAERGQNKPAQTSGPSAGGRQHPLAVVFPGLLEGSSKLRERRRDAEVADTGGQGNGKAASPHGMRE